jgi:hypothetical protein
MAEQEQDIPGRGEGQGGRDEGGQGGEAGPGEPDERGFRGGGDGRGPRGFTPMPPPAPTFDRESRAANNSSRHRFVVPIANAGPAAVLSEAESGHFLSPREGIDVPAGTFSNPRAEPRPARVPPRVRKWGVAFLLLLAFSGMLYATFHYVRSTRAGGEARQGQQQAGGGPANKTGVAGSEFVTTTDVNLRKGPDPSYAKVGTAEVGSTVRVIQVSGKWYQVQVVEHGRPKSDPDSADEGWVNSTNLKKS